MLVLPTWTRTLEERFQHPVESMIPGIKGRGADGEAEIFYFVNAALPPKLRQTGREVMTEVIQ